MDNVAALPMLRPLKRRTKSTSTPRRDTTSVREETMIYSFWRYLLANPRTTTYYQRSGTHILCVKQTRSLFKYDQMKSDARMQPQENGKPLIGIVCGRFDECCVYLECADLKILQRFLWEYQTLAEYVL